MNFLDTFLGLFAPHECLHCSSEGVLLCEPCADGLPAVPNARLLTGGTIMARTTYNPLAKALVWRLKADSARAAAKEIAALLPEVEAGIIVPVPTATSRTRQRGYDQAVLIARAYARRHGLPYRQHLVRLSQSRQVGATRAQRMKQLATAFRVTNLAQLAGSHIVLIDDVSTTGATLERAAQELIAAGAGRTDAVVFARVP
ncbi:MAG: putative Phosphoribosyltransferase [Candidatus Saccharibacteria bacterium]|nr:putative Phosphoribosyltransferase [Candidatus Saccharibacteria bacterium]